MQRDLVLRSKPKPRLLIPQAGFGFEFVHSAKTRDILFSPRPPQTPVTKNGGLRWHAFSSSLI